MGPQKQSEDVEANGHTQVGGGAERYHDDSDGSDNVDVGPDAPLMSSRPSNELDYRERDETSSWQSRLAAKVPPRLKRAWHATVKWVKGPQPPRAYSIRPFFPSIQEAPIKLLDRYAPKKSQRFWLLVLFYILWILSFSLVQWKSSAAADVPGYGTPIRLSCGARYWNDGNGCGLNGDQCRPFANATLAFRCPADCHKTQVLNPHAVGDQEIVYRPLVIGGPTDEEASLESAVYRSDSFICQAAVHSGFIGELEGGCGVLKLRGEQPGFEASKRHGIDSIGFDSYFPQSFSFVPGTRAQCKDLRWPSLIVSVFFSAVLSLFTTSPAVFFWSIFTGLFFQVALASDPPTLTDYYSLMSLAVGRFLPAAFCGAVTYKWTVKRSLTGLTAQVEKTVLWLGAAWVGALNNYTFDRIPIQRLTPHDLKAQPGAVPALIIVVLTIFTIALGQAWAFRVEGRMPRYLLIYTIFVVGLLLLLAVPGENVRIHHYILALLLLPGTSFQNRPSLLYQGLLVGLFVNGIARWGFDSLLQTPAALQGDAQLGSLLPTIAVAAIGASNITFDLGPLPHYDARRGMRYDGVSVLVNDVERFRGYGDDRSYWDDSTDGSFTWTWNRHEMRDEEFDEPLPEYFRFGYMAGSQVGDFTKAGKWLADGTWIEMDSGPSRSR